MKAVVIAAVLAFSPLVLNAQGPGPGMGQGMGPGAGMGKGAGTCCNAESTRGWTMMTDEERTAHRERMLAMADRDQCVAYVKEHRGLMEQRAKSRGLSLPARRGDEAMCARLARSKPAPQK